MLDFRRKRSIKLPKGIAWHAYRGAPSRQSHLPKSRTDTKQFHRIRYADSNIYQPESWSYTGLGDCSLIDSVKPAVGGLYC